MLFWPPKPVPGNLGQMARIMDGIADLIQAAAPAGNVFAWPVESITPPAVVVGYPTTWDYDSTFLSVDAGTAVVPVWFVVGKSGTAQSRNALSDVLSGAAGVKAILDGAHDWGDVRVVTGEPTEITIAAVTYLAARFDCEVI